MLIYLQKYSACKQQHLCVLVATVCLCTRQIKGDQMRSCVMFLLCILLSTQTQRLSASQKRNNSFLGKCARRLTENAPKGELNKIKIDINPVFCRQAPLSIKHRCINLLVGYCGDLLEKEEKAFQSLH